MIRFQIRGAMRWRTRMYAYCRRIHAPLSLLSSWKLVMQSALFAPPPSTSSPPVRSETAILIRLFHLPSFQALFTRQTAPLTSSSPSYHSSVGDDTGILELKERITRPTDRQTRETEMVEDNLPSPPCLERSCKWGQSRLKKNRRGHITHKSWSQTRMSQICVITLNLLVNPLNKFQMTPWLSWIIKKSSSSSLSVRCARRGRLCRRGRSDWEKRDKWLNRQKVPWWHKGGGDERKRERERERMLLQSRDAENPEEIGVMLWCLHIPRKNEMRSVSQEEMRNRVEVKSVNPLPRMRKGYQSVSCLSDSKMPSHPSHSSKFSPRLLHWRFYRTLNRLRQ